MVFLIFAKNTALTTLFSCFSFYFYFIIFCGIFLFKMYTMLMSFIYPCLCYAYIYTYLDFALTLRLLYRFCRLTCNNSVLPLNYIYFISDTSFSLNYFCIYIQHIYKKKTLCIYSTSSFSLPAKAPLHSLFVFTHNFSHLFLHSL